MAVAGLALAAAAMLPNPAQADYDDCGTRDLEQLGRN